MSSQLSIKLILGANVRRIPQSEFYLGSHPLPCYTALKQLVERTFPALQDKAFLVQYLDDEDDLITVSSDPELGEAARLALAVNQKVVKFFITTPLTVPTDLGAVVTDAVASAAAEANVTAPADLLRELEGNDEHGAEVPNDAKADGDGGRKEGQEDDDDAVSFCSDGVLVEIPPPTSTERAAAALLDDEQPYDAEAALAATAKEIRENEVSALVDEMISATMVENAQAKTASATESNNPVVAADVSQAVCVPTLAADAAVALRARTQEDTQATTDDPAPPDAEHKSADDDVSNGGDANTVSAAADATDPGLQENWPGMEEAIAASLAQAAQEKAAQEVTAAATNDTALVKEGESDAAVGDTFPRLIACTHEAPPLSSLVEPAPSSCATSQLVTAAEIDLSAFDTATEDARTGRGYFFVNGAGGWAEYTVELAEQVADYKVLVLLNSSEVRPLNLYINGRLVDDAFARNTTGEFWDMNKMQWFTYGPFTLGGGKTRVRLDTPGYFPHIKAIKFVHQAKASSPSSKPSLSSSTSSSSSISATASEVASAHPQEEQDKATEIESILRALAMRLDAFAGEAADGDNASDEPRTLPSSTPSGDLLSVLCDILSTEANVSALQAAAGSPVLTTSLATLAQARQQGRNLLHACITALPAIFFVLQDLVSRAPDFLSIVAPILKYLSTVANNTDAVAPTTQPSPPSNTDATAMHRNVICDGCDANDASAPLRRENALAQGTIDPKSGCIRGIRYKSATVEDFDLCATCEATSAWDDTHAPFLKINTPAHAPHQIICVLNAGAENPQPWRRRCGRGIRGGRGRGRGGGCRGRNRSRNHGDWRAESLRVDGTQVNVVPQQQQQTAAPQVIAPQRTSHTPPPPSPMPPPTPAPPVTPVPPAPPALLPPKARFVRDMTLADGALVPAGSPLLKIWRVKNPGPMAWPEGCRVTCVGGERLGAPSDGYPVPPLPPGEALDIEVDLVAPTRAARYTSYWRLQTRDGERFGHRFWLDIVVQSPSEQIANHIRGGMDIAQRAVTAAGVALARQINLSAQPTAPAPPSPSSVESSTVHSTSGVPLQPWMAERAQLEAMGFNDVSNDVLQECNGDIAAVVEKLLS